MLSGGVTAAQLLGQRQQQQSLQYSLPTPSPNSNQVLFQQQQHYLPQQGASVRPTAGGNLMGYPAMGGGFTPFTVDSPMGGVVPGGSGLSDSSQQQQQQQQGMYSLHASHQTQQNLLFQQQQQQQQHHHHHIQQQQQIPPALLQQQQQQQGYPNQLQHLQGGGGVPAGNYNSNNNNNNNNSNSGQGSPYGHAGGMDGVSWNPSAVMGGPSLPSHLFNSLSSASMGGLLSGGGASVVGGGGLGPAGAPDYTLQQQLQSILQTLQQQQVQQQMALQQQQQQVGGGQQPNRGASGVFSAGFQTGMEQNQQHIQLPQQQLSLLQQNGGMPTGVGHTQQQPPPHLNFPGNY